MNIQQLRDLAIKFIGLNCVVGGGMALTQLATLLWEVFWAGDAGQVRVLYELPFIAAVILYVALAYALLFRSGALAGMLWPVEEEGESGPIPDVSLETCVALIGLYYLPDGLARVAQGLMAFPRQTGHISAYQQWAAFLPHAVILIVALLCIIKSKAIAAYIRKCAE